MKDTTALERPIEREGLGEAPRDAAGKSSVCLMRADGCLEEVWQGIGTLWKGRPLYGASRSGLTPAKEAIGKHPERYKAVEPGSVFYNPMRILLGSISLLDEGGEPGITSPDYVVVRGRPGIMHPRVFYYWLRSTAGEGLIRELARGGVRERILFNRLCEGMIPVLPWPVQERLAEQLAVIPRARDAAQARLAAAEALPAAYLREVFEGLAGAAPTRLLGEISDTASGVTLGQRPHALHGREVPYLRVANVQDGHLRLDSVYKIRATDDEIEDLTLRRGDLVLTEGGDRDKLGRGTWWNDELPECIHQNHIFRVRLNDGVVEHEFFGFQLRSAYAKDYFLAHAKQTTGIATINRRILDGLPVLVPPLPAQRQIAADLARRLGEAEHLAACIREELAVIQALPAALLRAAFGGEPGPEHEAEA